MGIAMKVRIEEKEKKIQKDIKTLTEKELAIMEGNKIREKTNLELNEATQNILMLKDELKEKSHQLKHVSEENENSNKTLNLLRMECKEVLKKIEIVKTDLATKEE